MPIAHTLRRSVLFPLVERLLARNVRTQLAMLQRELALPWPLRRRRNQVRLANVLLMANASVPYYRDLFARIRFHPEKLLRDARYLEDVPVLTKADLAEAGRRILNERIAPYLRLYEGRTSGSTGSSLPVYYSHYDRDVTSAVNALSQLWAGRRLGDLELHLSSRYPETFPWIARFEEWVKQQATLRASVQTHSWEPSDLEEIWRRLQRLRPYLVQGHPSSMYTLARFLRDSGRDGKAVFSVFVSTGEALDRAKRAVIAEVFGCHVYDRYGNAEFGIVAHQADPERPDELRVIDPIVWVEVFGPREGAPGPLVLTALENQAAPLIRYAPGDESALHSDDAGLFLGGIRGRVHDVIVLGDRRYPTHYIQDLLTRLGGVDDFQIVQRSRDRVELLLVAPNEADHARLEQALRSWWPHGEIEVRFVRADQLIRTGAQNKFRYLVSQPAT